MNHRSLLSATLFALLATMPATTWAKGGRPSEDGPSLLGDYVGLMVVTDLAVVDFEVPAALSITVQDGRTLAGTLAWYDAGGAYEVPVSGRLSRKGTTCTLSSDGGPAASLNLDVAHYGGIAALTGNAALATTGGFRGGAAFVRPAQAASPVATGRYLARFNSQGGLPLSFGHIWIETESTAAGFTGDAWLMSDLFFTFVGTGGGPDPLVMVGAGPDGVIAFVGQAPRDATGTATSMAGEYLLETAGGSFWDAGTWSAEFAE